MRISLFEFVTGVAPALNSAINEYHMRMGYRPEGISIMVNHEDAPYTVLMGIPSGEFQGVPVTVVMSNFLEAGNALIVLQPQPPMMLVPLEPMVGHKEEPK